jgi:hypothetical protein
MSFADTLKGLIFKKPATAADATSATRGRLDEPLEGGRRQGEAENPYLAARRTWNDHVGGVVSSRQTWQVIGILSLLIALAGVGGVIHIGSQSKFIPYVVEVDKLGQTVAAGPVQAASKADAARHPCDGRRVHHRRPHGHAGRGLAAPLCVPRVREAVAQRSGNAKDE